MTVTRLIDELAGYAKIEAEDDYNVHLCRKLRPKPIE